MKIIQQHLEANWYYYLLGLLLYMPLFGHLNGLPLRYWDELRLAISAWEMLENGNYLVPHYFGEPDFWNTKPPIGVWAQLLFMKIIGVNELAVRLPSAFAALFTCIALLVFTRAYLKVRYFGVIAAMILVTSLGYVSEHGTRTGDYDALLALFSCLGVLFLFCYFESKRLQFYYLGFLAFALAVLTKGVAGLFFGPAVLLYVILEKKLISTLKNPHTYAGLLGMALLIAGYYLGRESINPGYLEMVSYNDLGGRFQENLGSANYNHWYYLDGLYNYRFSPWLLLGLLALPLAIIRKNEKLRKLSLISTLAVIAQLLVISVSATKHPWYDLPIYPFLALLAATPIWMLFTFLQRLKPQKIPRLGQVLALLFLVSVFWTPYHTVVATTYKPTEPPWNYEYLGSEHFLFNVLYGKEDLGNAKVIHLGINDNLKFYMKLLAEKGIYVELIEPDDLKPNDVVVTCQAEIQRLLNEDFEVEVLIDKPMYRKYLILSRPKVNSESEPSSIPPIISI